MRKATFYVAKGYLLRSKRTPFGMRKTAFCNTLSINALRNGAKHAAERHEKGAATPVSAATPCIKREHYYYFPAFLVVIIITPFLAASPYLSVVCSLSLYDLTLTTSAGFSVHTLPTGLPSTT